jgi:CheY-like chemotaxis protein
LETHQILIIDDDAGIRETLCYVIRLQGYTAEAVSNGREALAYLSSHPAPKLMMVDLMMPEMSGWEFLEQVRKIEELKTIPVVISSAYDENSKRLPEYLQLPKPIDMGRLSKILKEYCP